MFNPISVCIICVALFAVYLNMQKNDLYSIIENRMTNIIKLPETEEISNLKGLITYSNYLGGSKLEVINEYLIDY